MAKNITPVISEEVKPELANVEQELTKINPKIFNGLSPNQKAEIVKTFAIKAQYHSGPLPAPWTLKEYEEILPGCAKTIFDVFQQQTTHRISMESAVITSQQSQSKTGQTYAFIIAMFVLAASFTAILLGHDTAGTIVGSIDLVALVTVFITGKSYQKNNLAQKAPKEKKK